MYKVKWHPISEKPTNEFKSYLVRTDVMTRSMPYGQMYIALWDNDHDEFCILSSFKCDNNSITHWVELPDQPDMHVHFPYIGA